MGLIRHAPYITPTLAGSRSTRRDGIEEIVSKRETRVETIKVRSMIHAIEAERRG